MVRVGLFAAATIVATLIAFPAVSGSAESDRMKVISFEPDRPVASKAQAVPAAPDIPQSNESTVNDRPPPSNARIIISILALVISSCAMYFWTRGLRKSKEKPGGRADQGAVKVEVQHKPARRRERVVLRIAMAAASLITMFPPFYSQGSTGSRFGLGHSLIFFPPRIGDGAVMHGSIDAAALLAILAGIAVVTWFAIMLIKMDD